MFCQENTLKSTSALAIFGKFLKFLFSFYFPFLKTVEFSLFFSLENLEKKSGVQSPESGPDFILYPMLLTKFSLASTAIEIGNLSMGENLIMVSA